MNSIKRRLFLKQAFVLSGGLLLAGNEVIASLSGFRKKKIKGKITDGDRGIADVVVSDGYSVVRTDRSGHYQFELHPQAASIFISTPAGYAFNHENGIARHYRLVNELQFTRTVNFQLKKLDKDDNEHQFIIWADPQVKNKRDVEKLMKESVPDVQQVVAASGGALMHGITVGDIVWDEHILYPEYNRAVEKMGIPFFQCLGNHDMDYNNGGDDASDNTFQNTYGPTCYSFNRGKVHYVVMDNVRYMGKDKEYDGYFAAEQLSWLEKDLSFVGYDKLIVLCVHIPVHNGVKNNAELYAVLGNRKVHIMSGHTHYHRNVIKDNIFEHNHGTVCGAWWTGPVCGDGTPCGYGIYRVKGNELSWEYKSTGYNSDHQLKIFVDETPAQKNVQVNIWNHDPSWKIEYWVDDVHSGTIPQTEGFDPQAYATMLGPDLPKPRGFAEPVKTSHFFKTTVPLQTRNIKVAATDRFGKVYTATYKA